MFMTTSSHIEHWHIKNVQNVLGVEGEHTGVASGELAVAHRPWKSWQQLERRKTEAKCMEDNTIQNLRWTSMLLLMAEEQQRAVTYSDRPVRC